MRKSKLIVVPIVTAMVSAMLVGCGKTDAEPTSTLESVENVEVVETEENAETVATDGSTTETVESVVNEEVPEESASVETIESTEVDVSNIEENVEEVSADIFMLEIVEGGETTRYIFTEGNSTMYAISAGNVRELPFGDAEKLGTLSVNEEVYVTGLCNEIEWYKVDYNGMEGYVSTYYLSNDKVVIGEKPTVTSNLNILDPEPEGNYVPSTYEENGYTFLDLGMCIVSYNEREKFSDLNLTDCIGTDIYGINGPVAVRQCLETGAVEIWNGSNGNYWISGDGVRLGW